MSSQRATRYYPWPPRPGLGPLTKAVSIAFEVLPLLREINLVRELHIRQVCLDMIVLDQLVLPGPFPERNVPLVLAARAGLAFHLKGDTILVQGRCEGLHKARGDVEGPLLLPLLQSEARPLLLLLGTSAAASPAASPRGSWSLGRLGGLGRLSRLGRPSRSRAYDRRWKRWKFNPRLLRRGLFNLGAQVGWGLENPVGRTYFSTSMNCFYTLRRAFA